MVSKIKSCLYNVAEWIVVVFGSMIAAYLAVVVYANYFNAENSVPMRANIFLHVLVTVLVFSGMKAFGKFLNPHTKACSIISVVMFVLTLAYVTVVCFSYTAQTLVLPESDAKACFDISLRFLHSEFGAVVPEGSYLSLWPYQTGLIFINEKIMRILGIANPLPFQFINCVYVLLILISGYCLVCEFSKKIEARMLYLFLVGGIGHYYLR